MGVYVQERISSIRLEGKAAMAERPYVAEVCRGLLRRGSQGRKKGKLTLTAIMDMGHGGLSFSLQLFV